jgi:ribosomal protein S18 acetylase RimI-like enzyme
MDIIPATSDRHFDQARDLFQEYANWLEVDLCFQDFEAELSALETIYSPPAGRLLLALENEEAAGCVAVRQVPSGADGVCEMKRLYVRPSHRGTGLGRRLAESILEEGRKLGYRRMVLDTLASMERARAIYRALGFRETEPYYDNPLDGVHYMAMTL